MKNIFTKKNIMPVAVLGAICIAVAAILGIVNMVTSPIIEDAKNKAANAALLEVLPDATGFEEVELSAEMPSEIKKAHKADKGYVFQVDVKGKEPMTIMVGVDKEGKVTQIKILTEQETPGYKENVFNNVLGEDGKYNGVDSENLQPEIFSGATLTSNGVYSAVKAALNGYAVLSGGEVIEEEYVAPVSQRTDDELLALAGELVSDNSGFEFVEFDAEANNAQYLAKVMKEKSGKGYVAYVFSISSYYGTVDTENLIHIDSDGKIVNVNKLVWSVSAENPEAGYNPPSEEKLAEFYNGLCGKDSESIGEVDIHTGATNTTTTLVSSITEALKIVDDLIKNDMPTSEEKIAEIIMEMLNAQMPLENVTPDGTVNVKRIYKANDGNGYFAYVVAISPNYGTVETESLVHINNSGAIVSVKKVLWKVSDPKPEWGYNPPSDERVDQLYSDFAGKDINSLGDVDIVTGATATGTRLVEGITEALTLVNDLIRKDMPTPEEEVLALAETIVGKGTVFTSVTPNNSNLVKRLYRAESEDGTVSYVAYLVTISSHYGTVETETMVHISNDGEILAVEKLTWKVSDAVPEWGYNPPTEEELAAFYASLVGKTSKSIAGVDLKTGATNTTTGLVACITSALESVDALAEPNYVARYCGIAGACVIVLGIAAYIAIPKIIRRRKEDE